MSLVQAHVSPKKEAEVARIVELVKSKSVIGLARLDKVPAKALHSLRDGLRGDVVITMSKKKLVRIAFEKSGKKKLNNLAEEISGITAILFTDMNPIKLAKFLESKAVKGPAKGGDIAPIDILIKAGDTKLAPGPIISELTQNLKVKTMIKDGTVHIREDHVSHKKGELIDGKQAQLLARLGVEPMEIKLDFYSAWEDGELIPSAVLHLDDAAMEADVRLAASQALNLALSLNIMTEETIPAFIQKASRSAIAVAMELPMFFPELVGQYFAKAIHIATGVNAAALGIDLRAAATASASKSEPKAEPEKKKEDDDLGGGLGSLFG